jgi:hypothetical protein
VVAIEPVNADTIVIGAPKEDVNPGEAGNGAVYVFERDNNDWTFVARLTSPNPHPNDDFGSAIAIHGSTIVVGARGDRADPSDDTVLNGAVYVYEKTNNTWGSSPLATLRSPIDPLPTGASFGQQVAIWGETIAVGDRGFDGISYQEAVHIFRDITATPVLEATYPGVFNQSGHVVTLREDTLVVGSEWIGTSPTRGDAYVAQRGGSGWGAAVSLRNVAAGAGETIPDWFGASASIDDNKIAIGAGRGTGGVWLFDLSTGTPVFDRSILVPPSTPFNTRAFGKSLALSGPVLVVSAPWDCNTSSSCDDAQLYQEGSVFTFIDNSFVFSGPPSEPQDIVVVPGVNSLKVSWRSPVSDGGSPIIKYVATANPSCEVMAVPGVDEYSCVIDGLDGSSAYAVTVVAINEFGEGEGIAGYDSTTETFSTFRPLMAVPSLPLFGVFLLVGFVATVGSCFSRHKRSIAGIAR